MSSFNLIAPGIAQYRNSHHIITFEKKNSASNELKAVVRDLLDKTIKIFSVALIVPDSEKISMPSLKKPITSKKQIRFLLKHDYHPVFEKKNMTFSNDLTSEIPPLAPILDLAISAIQKEISSQDESLPRPSEHTPTLELFKKKSMFRVNCGHTFEEEVLNEAFKKGNKNCLICRTPITDLQPNFVSDCDENILIVEMFNNIAKAYIAKGALEDDLDAYRNALKDTQDIRDNELIPEFCSFQNKPLHAALAYLYLAKAQLQKQPEKVLETIYKAINLNSSFPEFQELQAIFYLHKNKNEKAYDLFYALAENYYEQKQTQEASNFYEKTLLCHPDPDSALIIFRRLIDLYDDPIKKENAYIRAIIYIRSNFLIANDIYIEARKNFPDSHFVILAFLSILPSDDQNRYDPYRSLADLYKKTDRFAEYTIVLQKLIRFKQDQDFEELSGCLFDQLKLLNLFSKWINHAIEQNNILHAEEIIQKDLVVKMPKTLSLLLRKEVVGAALDWGQFHEEQNQLDEAEKFYRQAFRLQKKNKTTSRLANLLLKQNNQEAVIHLYFDASSYFFLHDDFTNAALYYQNAIQIDPNLTVLSPSQRNLFKTFSHKVTGSTLPKIIKDLLDSFFKGPL